MDPNHWKIVKEAFSEVENLPESAREAALARYSEEIRAEVNLLLQANPDKEDFLEKPALIEIGIAKNGPDEDLSDSLIGNYRLIRKLGDGGMGTVYLAEHLGDGFSHLVALKLIKPGMDSTLVARRFLSERRILANLDHPNIAKMFDGGSTPDQRPYFVMEYIRGESIRAYCEKHRLGIRSRIELFLKVCSAVAYAHQNLVIHRDLKPSNILVTEDGEPKLLDFGIAKMLRSNDSEPETVATKTQFRILTPEYASPEQIRGDSTTTRSDVYSLGVILYELTAGSRPFNREQLASLIDSELSSGAVPPKPSTVLIKALHSDAHTAPAEDTSDGSSNRETMLAARQFARHLKGDLDNIILKAIRFEPEHRYATVNELAEDLQAYLQGLPVKATADSFSYRMRKFFQRHRLSALTASFFLVAILLTASVAVWQAYKANQQRNLAEKRFADVRTLARSLIFDAHDAIRDLPGSTPARRQLIASALEYLDRLAADASNDMTLLDELADGYERIGDVRGNPFLSNLGEPDAAIESYRKALEIRRKIAENDPQNIQARYAASIVHSKIRSVLQAKGDIAGAEAELQQAVLLLSDAKSPDTDQRLYRLTESRFRLQLGEIIISRNDRLPAEARDQFLRAIAIAESIPEDESDTVTGHDGLSFAEKRFDVLQMAYRRLGQYYEENSNTSDALANFEKALAAANQLRQLAVPPKPQSELVYAISLGNSARLLAATGSLTDAMAKSNDALAICKRIYEADPENYLAESELAGAFETRGEVLAKAGRPREAVSDFITAVNLRRKLTERKNGDNYNLSNLAETLLNLGKTYEDLGGVQNLTAAEKAYRESLSLWKEIEAAGLLPRYYANRPALAAEGIHRTAAR
ncbi:MAG: protein kinase [Acidobacteriota bacterium]